VPEDRGNRTKVNDLRLSLGELAHDPLVALQLQELEAIETTKDEFLPQVERLVNRLMDCGEVETERWAARAGLEVIANYIRYNQRWNDTLKTLIGIIKSKTKTAAAESKDDDEDALTPEQRYLTIGAQNETKKPGKPKAKKG